MYLLDDRATCVNSSYVDNSDCYWLSWVTGNCLPDSVDFSSLHNFRQSIDAIDCSLLLAKLPFVCVLV